MDGDVFFFKKLNFNFIFFLKNDFWMDLGGENI